MSDKYNVRFARFDAATNIFLGRELESVDKTNYEELYAGSLARSFFPPVTDVDEWDIVYTYKLYAVRGRAKVASKNGDDSPRIGLTMASASTSVKEITDSYGWTIGDIERAARKNIPLDRMTAMGAKMTSDREIDNLLAVGSSTDNIVGSLSNADIGYATAASKTSGTKWAANAATDPAKIIADLSGVTTTIFQNLKQATNAPGFQKYVALCPTDAYGSIATTARSINSDTTILKFMLANNPWLEGLEPWYQCDTAGTFSHGTGTGRMLVYPRNAAWGGALVPMDFRSLNPQEVGQEIRVPTRASCGGVVVRYPVASLYLDGL